MKSKSKKISYGIYRYGANGANQGYANKALVAIVEARNREEAEECDTQDRPTVYDSAWLKLDPEVTIWANQFVSAVPVSKISKSELQAFYEDDY
jgi:hypothetical protein